MSLKNEKSRTLNVDVIHPSLESSENSKIFKLKIEGRNKRHSRLRQKGLKITYWS